MTGAPSPRTPRRVQGPVALPAGRRRSIYAVAAGVWATGAGWLVWRYFLRRTGEFGPQADPLEAWWLKAHGLFAFASLWSLGLLWAAHVLNGWASGRRRGSGATVFAFGCFLAATGYLLYYAGEEVRGWVAYPHWIAGLLAVGPFAWHRLRRRPRPGPPVVPSGPPT